MLKIMILNNEGIMQLLWTEDIFYLPIKGYLILIYKKNLK